MPVAWGDGEEKGLLGSQALVSKGIPGFEKKAFIANVAMMANIDSMAAGSTAVALSASDAWLAAIARSAAESLKAELRFINMHQVGLSDAASFAVKKVPSIEFHSLDNDTFPILHPKRDTMKEFRLQHYADTYRLLAFYLAFLDTNIEQRPKNSGKGK